MVLHRPVELAAFIRHYTTMTYTAKPLAACRRITPTGWRHCGVNAPLCGKL